MDLNLDYNFIFIPSIVIYLIISGTLVGVFSGAYSAFYLSNISIINILNGNIKLGGKARFRKALVIIQFVICLVLITCSVFIINQVRYLNNVDLGIRKENILIVPLEGTDIPNNFEIFRDKLRRNPDILNVTGMMFVPGINYSTADFRPESNKLDNIKLLNFNVVKHSFVETFDINIVAGRAFSETIKTDENEAVIINEAMVRYLGWTNYSAIGRRFYFDGREMVIGVMKDFHIGSLREAIKPLVITMVGHQNVAKIYTRFSAIRIRSYNDTETISFIEDVWDEMEPSTPFTYTHFEDDLKNLYSNEVKILRLGIFFTIISVILAVMGVYVLIMTITNMQKREIGIRKALGANKTRIILMYMKKHISQLALAALIASPISLLLIQKWFENYDLKIPLNAFPFILSFVILTSISSLVVFLQSSKASDANPVDSIKSE
jgi:putative ABC transport system permease protein